MSFPQVHAHTYARTHPHTHHIFYVYFGYTDSKKKGKNNANTLMTYANQLERQWHETDPTYNTPPLPALGTTRSPLPTSHFPSPPPLLTAHLPISLPNALAVVAIRKAQGEVFVHLGDKTTQERDKARVESVGKSALQNGSYVQSWRRLDNQSVFKNQMRITATKRSADKRLRQKIIPIIYI